MIKKISITGGIGSGKSTVMKLLQQFGYCVWDADVLASEAMQLASVEAQIKTLLGKESYEKPGILNRDFVRKTVFSNPSLRLKLEEILHPQIQKLFENRINVLQSNHVSCWVFYEASLIFEKNLQNRFDANILVVADDSIRTKRIQESKNLPVYLISQIMSNQMPTESKKQFADFIIDNSESEDSLEEKVINLIKFLKDRF